MATTTPRRTAPRAMPQARATSSHGNASSAPARAITRLTRWMDARPLLDYTMVRTIVFVLAGLGVVMVASSSMTWSVLDDSSVWAQPLKQAIVVGLGVVMFWVALQIPPRLVERFSFGLMVVAILLLVAVLIPGIGTGGAEVGSQSWIYVAGFQLQPSELARVAICVWGASILANKDPRRLLEPANGFVPFVGVAALCMGLITLQGDLGMAVSFAIVVAFILIFAGVTMNLIWILAGIAAVGLLFVMAAGGYRSHRFTVYFDALFGKFHDTRGVGFQSHQGFLSLADGGLFGVGLGQSRAKWFYLPEAKNDYIFAVIGEELGLWGGLMVIGLFFLLLFFGLRTARRAQNQFQALMAASITTAIVSQAFINIGYVVGLLPVTGIQLPMISAGGTSAVITLGAMGLVASVARHEPGAVSSMQNYGRPLFDRMLLLREPTPDFEAAGSSARRGRGPRGGATDRAAGARGGRGGQTPRYGVPVTARHMSPQDRRGRDTESARAGSTRVSRASAQRPQSNRYRREAPSSNRRAS